MKRGVPFAYARTRALRGKLFGPEDGDRLKGASGAAAQMTALRALGVEAEDPAEVRAVFVKRFAEDADKLIRAWRSPLLRAIVGLVEIENLKLLFRPREGWQKHWLELGRARELPFEPFRDAVTLRAGIEAIAKTPYGAIAEQVLRAHGDDHAAIELALDRWASQRLLNEARACEEQDARELALRVVRERDLDVLVRKPFAAAAATVLLRDELKQDALEALSAWGPDAGPLAQWLPHGIPHAADLPALRLALAKARREACVRAFLGAPYRLASAVSLLLLRIAELDAVTAIAEARWENGNSSDAIRRAVAASAMGA